ncbi:MULTISPECIES: MurR/RpiR family transcriptional regulator [Halomonadaceae]|jgi:RpiR family transcriptional regulator, carbohydrate utilization regulator|uniref:Helix-turn-helix protein RpiR n=2 Tax=Vreelandella titanicae TaxID=664683 RepID=L9UAS5_9GAMM|nr:MULTISPECIES: MurR/RpiR family transcriptional regulator [Halomonas]NAO95577.1 transcriptional regulator HexR [Halomonas sp. MG34]QGQ72356.1 MurR/RpiR family transcriptional regulator [Halomonas sp. PA16-9]UEQ02933.1 MurR/RpiR family transcriptional regulator [Halomonas profundus]ELY21338.1 Helix-turn-helix protein RpiR [Halomonas titanicae BH1]KIN14027.1 transcriptional regulator [Halomonas sp. KHS3]|tara:strand:- start:1852 stop:2715 length:864 start_codon:yes stop_codon:yes gene_type:complete
MAHDLLDRLRERLEELNRSERKVANVILEDPTVATSLSIASLAQAASVSEPTVNRFCRNFGAKGYPDFKIKLAQSLAGGTPYVTRAVEPGDSATQYTHKIFGATIAALDEAQRDIDMGAVERMVDYLTQAKQIHIFGLGASGAVAQDAQHKFFRFNLPVMAYIDVLMQRMVAAACHTGDVVVIISYTGRTRELVDIARLARDAGAVVLGITAPNSPLANECTATLDVATPEDTDHYMPMTSRVIQLTLIDALATGVTLRRGEDFLPHLKKIKDSLRDTRFPVEKPGK